MMKSGDIVMSTSCWRTGTTSSSMDFATYDYVQCGKTLELNVAKGFVKDADGFTKGIEAKYPA